MQLSQHFSLEELTFSEYATRHHIDNRPDKVILDRLIITADKMEGVRTICGNRPVSVSSGYRAKMVNAAVGGASTSAHPLGYAVDFRVFGLSLAETISLIKASKLQYDQLIKEFDRWVHISFDPRNRRETFEIN